MYVNIVYILKYECVGDVCLCPFFLISGCLVNPCYVPLGFGDLEVNQVGMLPDLMEIFYIYITYVFRRRTYYGYTCRTFPFFILYWVFFFLA